MSRNIIKGDELMLWDENDQALLYATSHVLTLTGNTTDINTKDHGFWGASAVGNITWELTAECLYTENDYDSLFEKMISGQKVFIKWGKAENYDVNGLESCGGTVQAWEPSGVVKQGYAYITSLVANANTGENATFSVTYTGSGALRESSSHETNYVLEILYSGNFSAGQPITLFNRNNDVAGYKLTDATNNISAEDYSSTDNIYTPVLATTAVNVTLYIETPKVPSKLFENISALTHVEVGSSIEEMGYATFASCTNLESAVLNDKTGLTSRLFAGCTSLESLTLPFKHYDETNKEWVGIQYNTNNLNSSPLSGCESLTDIYVPAETVTWYENTEPWSHLDIHAIS